MDEAAGFLWYLRIVKAPSQRRTQRIYSGNSGCNCKDASATIDYVAAIDEKFSGCGVVALFSWYFTGLNVSVPLEQLFSLMRKSGKGLAVSLLLERVFYLLVDSTRHHLMTLDALASESGHAGAIETNPNQGLLACDQAILLCLLLAAHLALSPPHALYI